MNVLHVFRTYYPDTRGGIEEVIRQTCLSTRDRGVVSRVFALSPNPQPDSIERPEAKVFRTKQNFEIASCGA